MKSVKLTRIIASRKASRMTQGDCAAMLGIAQSQYTRIERGTRRLLATELAQLADCWGCPMEYFIID